MKKRPSLFALASALAAALVLFIAHRPTRAQDGAPDVDQVSETLDTLWTSDASIARVELSVVRPRGTRTLRMKVWTRGTTRALVVVESPERERGTATLRRDRNLWTYLPRVARTMRVPPSMMLSSWMGSDFTNDDLTQSASYREDFNGTIIGHSRDGHGWVLRYDAKEGVVGLWKRVDFIINADGTLPILAKYYDRRMRLARTLRFDQVREMGGRRIPTRLTLSPEDRPDEHTELTYLDIEFDAHVPSSTFSLTELERDR